MNSKTLAATRKLLGLAVSLAALVVTVAAKIEKLGTKVHAWALKATEAASQKKVEKAYAAYSGLVEQQGTIRRLANAAYADFNRAADLRDSLSVAVKAELATLA